MMKIRIPRSFLAEQVASVARQADDGVLARVYVLNRPTPKQWADVLAGELESWQVTTAVVANKDLLSSTTPRGPRIFLRRTPPQGPFSHDGKLEDSALAWFREQGGALFSLLKASTHEDIEFVGVGLDEEAWTGLFLGMELAAYQFKAEAFGAAEAQPAKRTAAKKPQSQAQAIAAAWGPGGWSPRLRVRALETGGVEARLAAGQGKLTAKLSKSALKSAKSAAKNATPAAKSTAVMKPAAIEMCLERARALGTATNFARHLVNLPPNVLNPVSMAKAAADLLGGRPGLKVDIWDEKRLADENMNLHLGVGTGSPTPPRMVHLKYRPAATGPRGKKTARPLALVGKGVTFDTGGLDIKPSAGMRLMKKDMGGSAAVLALAWWASETRFPQPLDFYLGLAENSVDGASFRPSDVLVARNGKSVEIHNTDAEGRLVLADVLDVAVTRTGADEPEAVIDLATLTGAIKVALGAEIAGLFSNDDRLCAALEKAGTDAGELNWRMPLLSRYTANFASPFADMVNAVDGFGGPITAALFLERFVRNKPWAHLDIYAWNDKATGALGSAGGSGQGVQTIVSFLEARARR